MDAGALPTRPVSVPCMGTVKHSYQISISIGIGICRGHYPSMKVCVAGAEFTAIGDAELNKEAISNANHGAAQRDPGHLCRSNDQGEGLLGVFYHAQQGIEGTNHPPARLLS